MFHKTDIVTVQKLFWVCENFMKFNVLQFIVLLISHYFKLNSPPFFKWVIETISLYQYEKWFSLNIKKASEFYIQHISEQ